jgi:prepilin-type N-terminal cleavage/methylation domain-containing protein
VHAARGFTLIEIMIVVAIIVILAMVAVPGMLRSRIASNEISAIENLRTIAEAQFTYTAAKGSFGTFAMLTSESGDSKAHFLDSSWVDGVEKSGYLFRIESADESNFVCYADPKVVDTTGTRFFRVDATGIIRWSAEGRPDADAPQVGSS